VSIEMGGELRGGKKKMLVPEEGKWGGGRFWFEEKGRGFLEG